MTTDELVCPTPQIGNLLHKEKRRMWLLNRAWMVVATAALAVACTSCQPKTPAKPVDKEVEKPAPASTRIEKVEPAIPVVTEEEPAPQPAVKAEPEAVAKPKPQQPPPPSTIPKVALSGELRAACLVKVGDAMPEAELSDTAGKMHALDSLYGEKLTVVCLWTIGTPHRSRSVNIAAQPLHDLMKEVVEPFGQKGVRVIGVNVGDTPAAVDKELSQAGVKFPTLLDPKGEYLAKLAKDKRMPRTFLLDAGGRILWFDIEYRRQSREELALAIRVVLGEL
jgi:peroxiredoxin